MLALRAFKGFQKLQGYPGSETPLADKNDHVEEILYLQISQKINPWEISCHWLTPWCLWSWI